MNTNIIPPQCARCQRHETAIEAYARDVVALDSRVQDLEADSVAADARIGDLEAERDSYRSTALAALDQLAALTTAHRNLRDRLAALLGELRALRAHSTMGRAA